MTTLNPLADRVSVRRLERDERTPGGVIIPATASDDRKAWEGEVLAVGPGKYADNGQRIEPRVKVGDRILVGKYSGFEVTLDGQQAVVLREDDILGVIEG